MKLQDGLSIEKNLTFRQVEAQDETMTEQAMLELVRSYTRANRWEVDLTHGQQRMQQRGVSFSDIEHSLMNANQCQV